jgi:D-alanyl-lipoteichoic acid acyltransferase DltB (MBOAT superfamily)
VDRVLDNPGLFTGTENLLAVYGYALQIFCDFSGYSDMAIGIALLFGFHVPANFKSPYQSGSLTEFWRRWHISLSSWLRDYLYISLGGNRSGKFRQLVNLMITMLLGGLWHGASWNFVLWGALHGGMLVVERIAEPWLPKPEKGFYRIVRALITFHFVCFCWIFFRMPESSSAWLVINKIQEGVNIEVLQHWITGFSGVSLLMAIGYILHFIPDSYADALESKTGNLHWAFQSMILAVCIWLVMQTKSSDIQPFIYFQF